MAMVLVLREWPYKPMPIQLESLQLSHILRRRILRDCLEKRVQEGVVVVPAVQHLEPDVADA